MLATGAVGIPAAYYFSTLKKQPLVSVLDGTFKPFTLSSIEELNHNTSKFRFKLNSNEQLGIRCWRIGLPTASCVVTKAKVGNDEKPTIRPYTPVEPQNGGYFDLIVKNYPNGKMSSHIHSLKVGDTLEIKG